MLRLIADGGQHKNVMLKNEPVIKGNFQFVFCCSIKQILIIFPLPVFFSSLPFVDVGA